MQKLDACSAILRREYSRDNEGLIVETVGRSPTPILIRLISIDAVCKNTIPIVELENSDRVKSGTAQGMFL